MSILAPDLVGTRVARDQVIAAAAAQLVAAVAARQTVGACTAQQGVVARLARQHVVVVAAVQKIIAITAPKAVAPAAAVKLIGPKPAAQHIVTKGTEDQVRAVAAVSRIVAVAAIQPVLTEAAHQAVIAVTAVQHIIAVAADQRVVAADAVQGRIVIRGAKQVVAGGAVKRGGRCVRREPGQAQNLRLGKGGLRDRIAVKAKDVDQRCAIADVDARRRRGKAELPQIAQHRERGQIQPVKPRLIIGNGDRAGRGRQNEDICAAAAEKNCTAPCAPRHQDIVTRPAIDRGGPGPRDQQVIGTGAGLRACRAIDGYALGPKVQGQLGDAGFGGTGGEQFGLAANLAHRQRRDMGQ